MALIEAEFGLPQLVKLLPALGTLAGAGSALYIYHVLPGLVLTLTQGLGRPVYLFLLGKWQWDALLDGLLVRPGLHLGYIISKVLDLGVVELVGPHGLSTVLPTAAQAAARLETGGVVTSYALYMLLGVLVLIL